MAGDAKLLLDMVCERCLQRGTPYGGARATWSFTKQEWEFEHNENDWWQCDCDSGDETNLIEIRLPADIWAMLDEDYQASSDQLLKIMMSTDIYAYQDFCGFRKGFERYMDMLYEKAATAEGLGYEEIEDRIKFASVARAL